MPCRNERKHIETCIRSLLQQNPPEGGYEIIVADGMSDDGTRDVLARLAREDGRLVVVDNPQQITPSGMNAGIAVARGRYIAIAGAHQRYAPDYLQQSVAVLEETGADNVGGALRCDAETLVQKAVAAAQHSAFGAGGARWHNPAYDGPADTVFGGLYRREVFDTIGHFDPTLVRNQDDEFNLRLTRAGGRIWQSSRIRSWYSPRRSIRALYQQYFQYGYWKVRVIRKHHLPASPRHLVPAAFVLSLAVTPLIAVVWPPAAAAWLALVVVYAAITVLASIVACRRSGWNVMPLMPVVFACCHFGYGIGFCAGLRDAVLGRATTRFSRELTRHS
jgi:glycosyltransferase involved in cell wall biosynthesis